MSELVEITSPTPSLRCRAIVIDQIRAEPHPCTRLATVLRPSIESSYYPLCAYHAVRILEADHRGSKAARLP